MKIGWINFLEDLFKRGMVENLRIRGELELVVRDKEGNIKDVRRLKNLVVNAGKAAVAGLINGIVTTPFTYIAIGTGTTAPAATDTALGNEVKRKSATTSRVTTTVTNDTAQLVVTFSSADTLSGTQAITESGVFDSATGGTMLCRQTFSALNINWDAGDTLQIIWNIRVT